MVGQRYRRDAAPALYFHHALEVQQMASQKSAAEKFNAQRPNQISVGDATFVPTQQAWPYLVVLMDMYSRQV
jgi:transposase InsO family protein